MSQATRKSRYDDVYHEIAQYQQIIDSLRAEIAEYKNKLDNTLSQTTKYQQGIDSLKVEIAQYKSKLDTVILQRTQKNTDLPREEEDESKNTPAEASSGV